ncbi:hypothetical protein HW132_31800 [Brasilonema sp. CT11]|nr:hypothetical protein [Brasilonema sp. CT11]
MIQDRVAIELTGLSWQSISLPTPDFEGIQRLVLAQMTMPHPEGDEHL